MAKSDIYSKLGCKAVNVWVAPDDQIVRLSGAVSAWQHIVDLCESNEAAEWQLIMVSNFRKRSRFNIYKTELALEKAKKRRGIYYRLAAEDFVCALDCSKTAEKCVVQIDFVETPFDILRCEALMVAYVNLAVAYLDRGEAYFEKAVQ